jgi:hypothetical protein
VGQISIGDLGQNYSGGYTVRALAHSHRAEQEERVVGRFAPHLADIAAQKVRQPMLKSESSPVKAAAMVATMRRYSSSRCVKVISE